MASALPRRFWSWYAAAWLVPWSFYFAAFQLEARTSPAKTALNTLAYVVPEALLGAGLVLVARRLAAAPRRGWLPVLVGAAVLVFTAAAVTAKVLCAIALAWFDDLAFNWPAYARGILLWQIFLSLLSLSIVVSVTFGLRAAAHLRDEQERRSRAELLRARSELKALRAQLNPHFLFNTLHSVLALVRESPQAAEDALERLGDLLRYPLRIQDAADDGVLLSEELDFARSYLALEKLRLGERLQVEEDVPEDALQCVVPAFVLQLLVENAIRHGLGSGERAGTIRIAARLHGSELRVQVRDDGVGPGRSTARGSGKGLELLRQRLRALYGEAGSVEIAPATEPGYSVTLRLPGAAA